MKKILSSFLQQILPITLGVYLGFAANNYGEHQKTRKQVQTFSKMLINEIEENLKSITNVSEYHIRISKDFERLLKSDRLEEEFNNYNFTGLRPGLTSQSAYDTGVQTGILQEFNLKTIQRLNKLYAYQHEYDRFNDKMIGSLMGHRFPTKESEIKELLQRMTMNLSDVNNFERELKEWYPAVLKELKKN